MDAVARRDKKLNHGSLKSPCARAFRSRCLLHRKRESQPHVIGCRILRIRLHPKKISVFASVETRVGEAKIPYEKIVLWSCDIVSRTGDG
jgi:hypothetical protein